MPCNGIAVITARIPESAGLENTPLKQIALICAKWLEENYPDFTGMTTAMNPIENDTPTSFSIFFNNYYLEISRNNDQDVSIAIETSQRSTRSRNMITGLEKAVNNHGILMKQALVIQKISQLGHRPTNLKRAQNALIFDLEF